MSGMSAIDYLKMPPPTPSIQSPPISHPPPSPAVAATPTPQLSTNDQMKLCSMKYKIMKNLSVMFQLPNLVSPFKNMVILQFLCMLIDKHKHDPDQPMLVRLHAIMDNAFRTASISLSAMDECIYLCNNPRIVEAIYLFTQQ